MVANRLQKCNKKVCTRYIGNSDNIVSSKEFCICYEKSNYKEYIQC